ncbi:porin [Pseudoalteromonas sp. JBTF-M23]|uniref:Porin n=1 Tax=Pseudoalteromonas caenipelagi TaxID=2726988 RepID=A0A849VFI1_9GAMM|nr:porin [Pseudoalteromonas caenipelagi]NOU51935.1 porin [Pseudoalteromonas caenipelagi]
MKSLKNIPVTLVSIFLLFNALDATANSQGFEAIQGQIAALQNRVDELEEKKVPSKSSNLTLYGSFRPALTYSHFGNGKTSTDVTDFYSRIGFKGEKVHSSNLTAFYQGEWDVDIEADSDFGDARLGFVGLKGYFGKIAIGKQYSPHYNTIAFVTDIFNNRASPFAYDEAGPARTNQLITYSYAANNLKFEAGIQANGHEEYSAGGDNTNSNNKAHIDASSLGIGYNGSSYYFGASFLNQKINDSEEKDFVSFAASWNVKEKLYLGITYRDVEHVLSGNHYKQSSLDIASAYSFSKSYKLKMSYFDWNGNGLGRSYNGYNVTFERHFNSYIYIFTEWLTRDIENQSRKNQLSVGIRYDFEASL